MRSFGSDLVFSGRILNAVEYEQLDRLYGCVYGCEDELQRACQVWTSVKETSINNFRTDEMIVWCVDNINNNWVFSRSIFGFGVCSFSFTDETDAVAFKLRFGDIDYEPYDIN